MKRLSVVALLASLAAGGCTSGDAAEATTDAPDAPKVATTEPEPTNIRTRPVRRQPFRLEERFAGEAQPILRVVVSAESAGKITAQYADRGDRVARGRTLARLDPRIASHQVAQATANLTAADDRLERLKKLREAELAAPQDVEQAQAARDAAVAALKLARTQQGMAAVASPIAGLVTTRFHETGEWVGPGTPLFELAQLEELKVVVGIPEDSVRHIEVGQEVQVEVPALPDRAASTGRVHHIAWLGNPKNRTYAVEVRVSNPGIQIRGGMLAMITAQLLSLPDAVVIARDAIVDGAAARIVYLASDGRATARVVELGPESKGRVVVEKGLEGGEQLIIEGQRQVVDGDAVRVLPLAQPALAPTPGL